MQDKQKVTLYLPPDLHRQLKVRAAVDMETMTDLAQKAISFYLAHSEVVDSYQRPGQTHRIYDCPSCSSPVVFRDGGLSALATPAASVLEDRLPMGDFSPTSTRSVGDSSFAGSAGDDALVTC
jgi:hypothetical protein